MFDRLPTLGIRFDLKKAASKWACWEGLWRAIETRRCAGFYVFDGMIKDTGCQTGEVFYVAFQGFHPGHLQAMKEDIIRKMPQVVHYCAQPTLSNIMPQNHQTLSPVGRINYKGELVPPVSIGAAAYNKFVLDS